MVVDYVGSGADDNHYRSAGRQKVDMHFCHAVVEAVWNVSYLSWQGSAQRLERIYVLRQCCRWGMRYKWGEERDDFCFVQVSQPLNSFRGTAYDPGGVGR